jgi:hypothetical protein
LEDNDAVGESAGVFDAAFVEGSALVETEEELVGLEAEFAEEALGGVVFDFDGDFFEEAGEGFGEFGDGGLDEVGESRFADWVGHVVSILGL